MLRFRFRSGEQYTLSHCAKLVAIGFIGRDADVCKALVGDADLLLAEVVAQCLDTAEVVVCCTEGDRINYVKGANIAGFLKVAQAILEQGIV